MEINNEKVKISQIRETSKVKGGGDNGETCRMTSPVYGPVAVHLKTGKVYNILGKEVDWCDAFPC